LLTPGWRSKGKLSSDHRLDQWLGNFEQLAGQCRQLIAPFAWVAAGSPSSRSSSGDDAFDQWRSAAGPHPKAEEP
jgi:hypothetical protein